MYMYIYIYIYTHTHIHIIYIYIYIYTYVYRPPAVRRLSPAPVRLSGVEGREPETLFGVAPSIMINVYIHIYIYIGLITAYNIVANS